MTSQSSSATGIKNTAAYPPSTRLVWIPQAEGDYTHSAEMKINCTTKFCENSICMVPIKRLNNGTWKSGACYSCNKHAKTCNLARVSAETLDAYQAGRSDQLPKAELCPITLARRKKAEQLFAVKRQQSADHALEHSSTETVNNTEISEIEEFLGDAWLEAEMIDHQTNCQLSKTGSCDRCSMWQEMKQIFLGEEGPNGTFDPSSATVPTMPSESQAAQSGEEDVVMQDAAETIATNAESNVWTRMGESLQNQQRRGPRLLDVLHDNGLSHII